MSIITLVSYIAARKGYVFRFEEAPKECLNCRFRTVCVDKLKKGHVYKVTKVFNIRNRCPLNEYVITVEVEEISVDASLPKKLAIEGMIVKYAKIDCQKKECPHYSICRPKLLPDVAKVRVEKVKGKINCPLNYSLVEASLKVID